MQLVYVDRKTYRDKTSPEFLKNLGEQFGKFYLLPEGGSNALAVKGCAELVSEITQDFDIITVACGTGATLAGLINGLSDQQNAIGFPVLKNGEFLSKDISTYLKEAGSNNKHWRLETSYHFGGYAKTNDALWNFINNFKQEFDIELDAVYTGKMFYGLFDLIQSGAFPAGTRIVAIHTGGLQGNAGFK